MRILSSGTKFRVAQWKATDVSEEHIDYIRRAEE
jgi:hypothetical protein